MTRSKDLSKGAGIFSALGDETRLSLVQRLVDLGNASISDLTHGLPMSRQAATRHLHVLESAGVVVSEKQGREQHFRLNQKPFSEALNLLESIERKWDRRLARLKLFAENNE